MSDLSKRLKEEIHQLEVAVDQRKADWDKKQHNCANPECGKDIRKINPTYGINDSSDQYCSRRCRATKTGERWEGYAEEVQKAPESTKPAKPVAQEKAGKKIAASAKPASKGDQEPKPAKTVTRSGSSPLSNLAGKLHLTGEKPKFQEGSSRAKVFAMIKEGMTLGDLYTQCEKAGIDGKGTLGKILALTKSVEVK